MPEVVLHESLDRPLTRHSLGTTTLGQPQLLVTSQYVLATPGLQVQVDANPGQHAVPVNEHFTLSGQQRPAGNQFFDVGRAVATKAQPANQVHVAESAGRPLDIGNQLAGRESVSSPLGTSGLEAVAKEPRHASGDHPPLKRLAKRLGQSAITPQPPRLNRRGGKFDLRAGQGDRASERVDPVAQLQSHVPVVADRLGTELDKRLAVSRVEKQQVDIRTGRQLGSTRSSHRQDRSLLAQRTARHASLGRLVEQLDQEPVGLQRQGLHQFDRIDTLIEPLVHRLPQPLDPLPMPRQPRIRGRFHRILRCGYGSCSPCRSRRSCRHRSGRSEPSAGSPR